MFRVKQGIIDRKCLPLLTSTVNSINFMFSPSSLAGSILGVLILSGVVFILSGCMGHYRKELCLSTMVVLVFLPILGKDFALETGCISLTIPDT